MYWYEEGSISRAERVKQTEEEILNIIKEFLAKYKYSPTIREIAKKSSVSSSSTVSIYLEKLKKKGLIDWEPKRPRTIKVLEV